MSRMKRVVLPNYPNHVVQRGHNRQVVCAEAEDFQRYLSDLYELATNKSVPFCRWISPRGKRGMQTLQTSAFGKAPWIAWNWKRKALMPC